MSAEFFFISLLLAMTPGTGVLYAVSCGLVHGARGAFWSAVAGALGVFPHILVAGLGLSAFLQAGSLIFETVRIAGALYLIYLAYKTWASAAEAIPGADTASMTRLGIVFRGVLINLLNPKLTLFFLAFLPQFLTPGEVAPVAEIATLGAVLVGQTFFVFLVYGITAYLLRARLQRSGTVLTRCNQGIACLFVALGARILVGVAE